MSGKRENIEKRIATHLNWLKDLKNLDKNEWVELDKKYILEKIKNLQKELIKIKSNPSEKIRVAGRAKKKKRKSFSSKLVVGKKYKFVGDTSKGDFKDIETFRVVNKKKAKDYQSGWKRGDTIYKILFDDDSVADWYSQQELGSFKLIKNNPIGGSMDNKKLLMYAALAVGGWYAWAWWQKKKLGAGVQSALTQGSTTAQQMVSFI